MINRAKAKPLEENKDWVEFHVARAENLPFDDDSFDAAIGWAFLHFTDCEVALKEMRRVVRSGGVVASFHPLADDYQNNPFFLEWFFQVFNSATKRKQKQPRIICLVMRKEYMLLKMQDLTQINSKKLQFPSLFHDPLKVVKHLIHGVGGYQEELAELPWKARQEIVNSLVEQGKRVCEKYPKEERITDAPIQVIKGIVP